MSDSPKKVAIVLFNLGGPDSKEAIEPFLFNFFMDPNIVSAPKPIRYLLAKYISKSRSRGEAGEGYKELGYKSPLLANSQEQAKALEKVLNERSEDGTIYKTYVCMRYWKPMAEDVFKQITTDGVDEIALLPLYPQFSTTTTWSSLGVWKQLMRKHKFSKTSTMICCYPLSEGFVKASAENIRVKYEALAKKAEKEGWRKPRVLFSAHGLPEKIIKAGDPYQYQCEISAERIAREMGIKHLDWATCYQSRVGPLKWIGPSTEEALAQAAADKAPVIVYPHAFVNEHIETLVELDIEYKELSEKIGIPAYERADTVGTHPLFISDLAEMVFDNLDRKGIHPGKEVTPICPERFGKCCCRGKVAVY